MTTDKKIIELFFQRSEEAIQELDRKYGVICRRLSFNIVNDNQDMQECIQDAYLAIWNAIPPAKPDPLLTYILKIVRNASVNLYRYKARDKRNSSFSIALQEIEPFIAAENNVEAEIEAKELARIIESFLDTLTRTNRVIFMRRYWFGDSYKEIAEFTGLSEKNISVRLVRMRKQLKEYLSQKEVLV